jgi:glucosamine--fructose-6-phosphate aminotransferase (isomerizing)
MCGIVGVLSHSDATDRIFEGLSLLEYRGYDSAGIAVMDEEGRINLRRSIGKLDVLKTAFEKDPLLGKLGIGHTRWATHGAPTEENAHPHSTKNLSLVQNGIIENYVDLRHELEAKGVQIRSETDTEVAAHLLESLLYTSETLDEAFTHFLRRIAGSYALAVIFEGYPDLIFAAKQGSPLAIGYGDATEDGMAEMFLGSDALALAPFTKRVSYLEDGDRAIIRPDRVLIIDAEEREVTRDIIEVPSSTRSVDKGPYRHFMLKEIHEQPESLTRLLSCVLDTHDQSLRPFLPDLDFSEVDKVTLVACGTAHYACHVAKYWFQEIAGISTEIDIASEFRYRKRIHSERELVIAVSQSGETADTLAAIKDVGSNVAARLAVVNVSTSSIAREADFVLDIEAGPEIGVASTKAFTGQMLALLAIAIRAGQERGTINEHESASLTDEISSIPRIVRETLALSKRISELATRIATSFDCIFLGRGVNYPIALEAALKLTEISYIHANGYAAGELKHGPIALIDQGTPVVVFEGTGPLKEKTLSNAAEVEARGAAVWQVGQNDQAEIRIPDCPEIPSTFAYAIVAQLLAYHVAREKGTDVDQPRNLAKSVTVE